MTNKVWRALYGSPDRPLKIGNLEIPCYVLENETRVLSERGIKTALVLDQHHSSLLKGLLAQKNLRSFIRNNLVRALSTPIRFIVPGQGGRRAVGYEATIIVDICDAVLDAWEAGMLTGDQLIMAKSCEILARTITKVGIIDLVDEVTGYQDIRDRLALQAILEKYISKELMPWTIRFPDDFYKELFRLRNWQWRGMSINRPSAIGKLTNDIVYERLAPGVLDELKRITPKEDKRRTKQRYQQGLPANVGHPALSHHLYAVIALMRASVSWNCFIRSVQRAFPKPGDLFSLDFEREYQEAER